MTKEDYEFGSTTTTRLIRCRMGKFGLSTLFYEPTIITDRYRLTNILYFSRIRALLSGEQWIGYLKISKNNADREQMTRLTQIMLENRKKLDAEDAVIEAKRITDAAKAVVPRRPQKVRYTYCCPEKCSFTKRN